MCRLRAAFGDCRDGLAPHPHAVAQMVRGGMADRARQARRVGSVPGARTGALRHGLAYGAQVAPRAERAVGIPVQTGVWHIWTCPVFPERGYALGGAVRSSNPAHKPFEDVLTVPVAGSLAAELAVEQRRDADHEDDVPIRVCGQRRGASATSARSPINHQSSCRRSDSLQCGATRPVAGEIALAALSATARNCPVFGRGIG